MTDGKKLTWYRAMVKRGHTPRTIDHGEGPVLNILAHSDGCHNGPGCSACGWECCWHCDEVRQIPDCPHPVVKT